MLLFRHGVRRAFACTCVAALLVVAGLGAVGCGGSGSSSSSTSGSAGEHEPVTLTIGWFFDGKSGAFKSLLDSFKEKYPWITVQEQSIPYGGYYQKLGAWTSANEGPDAIILEPGALGAPYLKSMRPLDKSAFQPLLDSVTDPTAYCQTYDCDKGVYSVGFGNQGYPLYYNKDILREAGLDPGNPPRTFGEMTTACEAIKQIGKACWSVGGKDFGLPIVIADTALRVVTKEQMLALADGRAKWTDPEFKQVLTLIQHIGESGWYQDGFVATSDQVTPFAGGKTAFVVGVMGGGGADWSDLGTAMGYDKIGVVPMPKLSAGDVPGVTPGPLNDTAGVTEGQAIVVPRWSKHPEEAELLIRTTVDPVVQKAMLNQPTAATMPSLTSAQASWSPQPIFGETQEIVKTARSADLLTYMGYTYLPTVIAQLQQLSLGKTTVDDAAVALQKAADAARSK